ncbi:MAG: DNA-binding response regulator [Candidatus Omnitrophota bacterium]|jgi:DNA-binding response OmpR family regulator|nr:MAG: DNA-binding response regulator [Candidatus Omnitrophota bacterium]
MDILIAEDNSIFQMLLKSFLEKWGYEVETVGDGEEAFRRLTNPDAPQLVIMDWMMPKMKGVEVCQKLREIKTENPPYLILLTFKSEKENIVEGLKAGANDYITKPFDNKELLARIEVGKRVLELQRALIQRNRELQEAIDHVRTLQGILPICMYCKKIRDDKGYWNRLEFYIKQHSDADFSHCVCPECLVHQNAILDDDKT